MKESFDSISSIEFQASCFNYCWCCKWSDDSQSIAEKPSLSRLLQVVFSEDKEPKSLFSLSEKRERRSPVNGVAQDSYCESFMNSILGAALANLYLFIWISTDLVQVLKRDTLYLTLYLLFESGIPDPLIESTVICGIRWFGRLGDSLSDQNLSDHGLRCSLAKKKSVGAWNLKWSCTSFSWKTMSQSWR